MRHIGRDLTERVDSGLELIQHLIHAVRQFRQIVAARVAKYLACAKSPFGAASSATSVIAWCSSVASSLSTEEAGAASTPMRPAAVASDALPAGYGGVVITTLILIVVAQIVLQAVLAIGQGNVESVGAAEQAAAHQARRNAYFVLAVAAVAAVGSTFVQALTIFDTANVVIVGLALAEIVQSVSQLFYTRR